MTKKKGCRFALEALEGRTLMSSAPAVGLQGIYFDNSNFTGKSASRVDPQVNFSWSGAPISGISATTFSARWTGTVTPQHSQSYTFYVTSNNGARLWINHHLLIDDWTSHNTIEDKGAITLSANKAYDIQLEFWNNTGSSAAQLKWSSSSTTKGTIPSARLAPASQDLMSQLDHDLVFAQQQVKLEMSDLGNKTTAYSARTSSSTGKWQPEAASDWTSGFFPGEMWQLYDETGNSSWSTQATAWTKGLASQDTQQGDLAFRLMTTFLPLYEQTGNPAYAQVLLTAAASKQQLWNPTIGAFETTWRKSSSGNPNADFGVLMDQTTDMQLMLWAAQASNNQSYYDEALSHVRNVITNMVRPDGSTYQWGYFDSKTGAFVDGETYQGFSNDSTWARGQAWAIYSFSDIAKTTGQPDILAGAQKVADWFIAHLPSDSIPYWDFNDPKIPSTYRDSSAAAIAASGLIELSTEVKSSADASKYRSAAEKILASLSSSKYLAEGTNSHGVLLHAAQNVPNDPSKAGDDVSLSFGDYYFLEAINRYRALVGA